MKKIFLFLFLVVSSISLVFAQEWEYLDSGVSNDLNSISCPSEMTCYVAGGAPIIGGLGIVIKTTDGGETWEPQTLPTTEPLRAIKCVDTETCYASGNGIILKKTAATPWTLVNRSGQTLWDIAATSSSHAVAVGDLGTRLRTINGGVSWSGYLPPRTGTFERTLFGIFFIDGERGWVVGEAGVLRYTDDGGATWTNLDSDETLGLSDIFTLDGETFWTCGSFTHISKSIDSASSWTDYDIPSVGGCGAIEFANSTLGWFFGNGAILRSEDGGETWEMISGLERTVFFRDIECFGGDLCYGVGDDGIIIRYDEPQEEASPEPEPEEIPPEEEPRRPTIDTDIPPVNYACPAIMDDCEAGWYPVFEYNSVGCAVSYTCVQEESLEFEIDDEMLAEILSRVPGLGANERINIYAAEDDGSQKVWGVIIENKKVKEIVSLGVEDPTLIAETTMQTLERILYSSEQVNEVLAALKSREIKLRAEKLNGKIKLTAMRVILFFIASQEKTSAKFKDFEHIEDADINAELIEPKSSEREEFARIIISMPPTCEPEQTRLNFGSMDWEAGGRFSSSTIVAPHGAYDFNTDSLLLKIKARYPANYVIAREYETDDIRINVNRPSERLPNGTEIQTARSTRVYNVFKNCVEQYEQKYYIELHGNSAPATANEIEVATVNVNSALATYLVNRFNVHKRGKLDGYRLSIEPLDSLYWSAGQNKQIGMLSHCDNICLHLEVPYALREENGDVSRTAEVLSNLFRDLESYPPKTI